MRKEMMKQFIWSGREVYGLKPATLNTMFSKFMFVEYLNENYSKGEPIILKSEKGNNSVLIETFDVGSISRPVIIARCITTLDKDKEVSNGTIESVTLCMHIDHLSAEFLSFDDVCYIAEEPDMTYVKEMLKASYKKINELNKETVNLPEHSIFKKCTDEYMYISDEPNPLNALVKIISQPGVNIEGNDTTVAHVTTGITHGIPSYKLVNEETYFNMIVNSPTGRASKLKATERENDIITRFLRILDKEFEDNLCVN